MRSIWKQILGAGLALTIMIGAMACASAPQPFDYHDDREEKPGPGLFSGEDGGLVVPGKPEEETAGEQAGGGATP